MIKALATVEKTSSLSQVHIGPYRLTRLIDRTGTSAVYEAVSERLNRIVVVKLFELDPHQSEDEQWVEAERWRRVMTAVSELANPPRTHAHLARVSDFHTFVETPVGVRHYAVMELLSGSSLHAYFKERTSLTLEALAHVALQIASAVDSLHAAGVAHGSIEPRNILFDGRESKILKLVGFGMDSIPLDMDPTGASKDRHDLAAMIKEAITTHGLNKPLPVAAKTVLVRALEPHRGYATAMEFAREFRTAIGADERELEDSIEPSKSAQKTEGKGSESKRFMGLLRLSLTLFGIAGCSAATSTVAQQTEHPSPTRTRVIAASEGTAVSPLNPSL